MFPTIVRLSKASRRPLTSKKGNKDYYKGTRQAYLPGGLRTGAPGKHVVGGKAKYRLLDEKVRVFVAPPLEQILSSPLKPYVHVAVNLKPQESQAAFGRFTDSRGLSPEHFLRVAREKTGEALQIEVPDTPSLSWPKRLLSKSDEASAPATTGEAETSSRTAILEEIPSTSQTTTKTS
ncbi:hypothetical protein H0H93_013897 [Arthromyces matolae]|nr:hypothetical protein H0H93_013897 [Arthromyces matolae]